MFKSIRWLIRAAWNLLTWTRILILNLLFLGIIILIFQGTPNSPNVKIPNNSALAITPYGALVDQTTYDPSLIDALSMDPERPSETRVRDVVKAIHFARDDDQISGIILRLDFLQQAGISKIEEIGQAINFFKESGKPIVAFADSLSQQQYLMASYADEIYINTLGGIYINGFGVYRNYYKNAADKLSIKFHVFRVGTYKDAVEPFIRDSMSEQSREHVSAWLNQLWQRFSGTIEAHRDLNKGAIDDFVNEMDINLAKVGGDAALLAMENGLIDGAYSRNGLKKILEKQFGTDDKNKINAIDMKAYLQNPLLPRPKESSNKIGLIVAAGNIVDGKQPEGQIGSETLSKLIRRAKEDSSLSALVVRVDSGGGSAFASEVIREELELARDNGLPIYISMGSVAASGGYWISAPATEIWATPTTLTGSIGVFGLIPNIADSLEKLGVHSDGVGTSALADAYYLNREMSPQTQRVIQSGVNNIYQRFLTLVADARDSTPEEIDRIAQGRVWSGEMAIQLGLVDKLGSLEDVIRSAAKAQNLTQYSVKEIKRELSSREQFVRALMEQTSASVQSMAKFMGVETGSLSLLFDALGGSDFTLSNTHRPEMQIYARCTECLAP